MANSLELDQDELAHNEPSHLDPHCLLSSTYLNSESDYESYSKVDHGRAGKQYLPSPQSSQAYLYL